MRRQGGAKPKSTIITDTPEREWAALATEGKNKKKSRPVKYILHRPSAEAEPEPGEVVEDGERTNSEEPIKFQDKDLEQRIMFLSRVQEKTRSVITSDSSLSQKRKVALKSNFACKSATHVMSCCFVEPYTEEINYVEKASIMGVQPHPTL